LYISRMQAIYADDIKKKFLLPKILKRNHHKER
jgi:hypothetical protein